jgi:hypothetical protein
MYSGLQLMPHCLSSISTIYQPHLHHTLILDNQLPRLTKTKERNIMHCAGHRWTAADPWQWPTVRLQRTHSPEAQMETLLGMPMPVSPRPFSPVTSDVLG